MRWIGLLLMLSLWFSCGSNRPPSNVLPREKMEIIVWQLAQSDEYVNSILSKDSTKKSSTERMLRYAEIFDLNHVTEEEFKRSYQFYMTHPEVGKLMFDSIAAKASRQRDQRFAPKPDTTHQPVKKPDIKKADSTLKPANKNPLKRDSALSPANHALPKRDSTRNPFKQKLRNNLHPQKK